MFLREKCLRLGNNREHTDYTFDINIVSYVVISKKEICFDINFCPFSLFLLKGKLVEISFIFFEIHTDRYCQQDDLSQVYEIRVI